MQNPYTPAKVMFYLGAAILLGVAASGGLVKCGGDEKVPVCNAGQTVCPPQTAKQKP